MQVWRPWSYTNNPVDRERETRERETFITKLGESLEKIVKGEINLREAKAMTLRRVLLARSCAMGGD